MADPTNVDQLGLHVDIRLISNSWPARLGPRGISNLLSQLSVGQRIIATVETKLTENSFLLKIADTGHMVNARSQLPLSPNQTLNLEVVRLGPTPELKVLTPELLIAPETAAIRQAWRQYLPRQASLADLTGTLQYLAKTTSGNNTPWSEPLSEAIRAVLDALPQKASLATPEGMKQAIRDCGLFFEAKLGSLPAGAEFSPASDLKSRFLALADMLKNFQGSAKPTLPPPAQPVNTDLDLPQSPQETPSAPAWATRLKTFLSIAGGQVDIVLDPDAEPPSLTRTDKPPHSALANASHADSVLTVPGDQTRTPGAHPANSKEAALGLNSLNAPVNEPLDLKMLMDRTESVLAKIILDQLASLPQHDSEQLAWQIELPFKDGRHADSAKLRIIKEGKSGSQSEQAYWSVILQLNPPGLGTIYSRISLAAKRIETVFWSDHGATSELIRAHLELLAARFQQAGLEIGRLDALAGPPAEQRMENGRPLIQLVDERA